MPCFASATLAAALAIEAARSGGIGACYVVGGLALAPTATLWMASANGVEVATGWPMVRAVMGERWADGWAEAHPAPEPVTLAEAVQGLEPGLLVVAWR